MIDLSHKLTAVLESLPISVGLFSKAGRVLGHVGGRKAGLRRSIAPSQDPREAARWSFIDGRGAAIPRTHWASARALRGEINDAGLVGAFWKDGEQHLVRVTCVPTFAADSDVAVVSFLQFLDTPSRGAELPEQDLPQRLIRELAKAVASDWRAPVLTAAGTTTPS